MQPNTERQYGCDAFAASTAWKVAKQVIADDEGIEKCTITAVAQLAAGILARPTTQDVEGALRNIVVSLEAIKEGIDEAGKKRKLAQ